MAGKRQTDLTDQTFNNWYIKEYLGKSKYIGECLKCGETKELNVYFLNKGQIPKCICETGKANSKGLIDLKGQRFGNWIVLEYMGNKEWKCECQCDKHTVSIIKGCDLRNNKTKSCGKCNKDLNTKEKCNEGLDTKESSYNDLTGKIYHNWKVLKRAEVQGKSSTMWTCECQCDKHTIRDVGSYELRNGLSKSCGCLRNELKMKTNLEKYGVEHPGQIGTQRTKEQLEIIKTKESLSKYISENFNYKPSYIELADKLGISRGTVRNHILKYNLEDSIKVGTTNTSGYENGLRSMFPCEHPSDREALGGKEIDLYYPDKKFGIEFNGNYWHSELKKDKYYHRDKSIEAAKKGIQLFNIFEYEWNDKHTQQLLKKHISNKLYGDRIKIVYGRETEIKEISKEDAKYFLEENHFQGNISASISLGCFYNNELIGVMTFGLPRFNKNYQYELIRLAWKSNVKVLGGSEKLFKYFLNKYNPDNIISYCDISKFTGNVYINLGFKLDGITEPNYVWINLETYDILKRYQTQKKILISKGWGTEEETEEEIMYKHKYTKIYDCGNYRYTWTKENKLS